MLNPSINNIDLPFDLPGGHSNCMHSRPIGVPAMACNNFSP